MFRQEIPYSFLWLISLCAVLSIGIISCGGDDGYSDWIGTWAVETVDGQSYEQFFQEAYEQFFEEELEEKVSVVTDNWTFNDDGTMEVETAVRFSGEVSSLEMTGTYSLSGFNYTVTLTVTKQTGLFDFSDNVDTGTWSRTGSTLTINSDDGTITVLKKK